MVSSKFISCSFNFFLHTVYISMAIRPQLLFSFGALDSFLAGLDRNVMYGACCSAHLSYKPVSTSSAKQVKFGYSEKATKFEKIFHLKGVSYKASGNKQKIRTTIRFSEGLEDTPLTLLINVKFCVEDFFKFCGLLRISEL